MNRIKGPVAPGHILALKPYVPGKPIEELEREYGISGSIKLASNENPIGPSPKAVQAIENTLKNLHRYPDGASHDLTAALAARLGCGRDQLVLGNGSDEIIQMLCMAFLSEGDNAVMSDPAFLMYEISVRTQGAVPVKVPLAGMDADLSARAGSVDEKTRLVFVNNPNNPTGSMVSTKDFERFLEKIPPEVLVVVDEAYIEFARDPECLRSHSLAASGENVVTLRTFSKAYGLAGLRVGYGVMPAGVARVLQRIRLPFNVNLLAQAGAIAALSDEQHLARTVEAVHQGLDVFYRELSAGGVEYSPSQANFLLVKVDKDADDVFEALLKEGIIVRSMRSYGFPNHIRVSVGLPEENRRFLEAFFKVAA
ncbi:MAG: histidinol-phosphate transaminase [Deltaproteobacteria bacterium]|nr:histidinol-phosphate transaminase [Deltaproteobacteria bacterium]